MVSNLKGLKTKLHFRSEIYPISSKTDFRAFEKVQFWTEIDTFSAEMLSQSACAMFEMKSGDVITDGDFKIEISSPGSVRDQILDSNRFWVLPQLYFAELKWAEIETIISSGLRLLNCHPTTYTKEPRTDR